MNSVTDHQQKHRSKPRQPLDRHMSEIGEYDGGVYINAGIDSTWLVIKKNFHKFNLFFF